MKKIIVFSMLLMCVSLKAQVVFTKSFLDIFCCNDKKYDLVNSTEEDVTISIKRTNAGYRLAILRSSTAWTSSFYIKNEDITCKSQNDCLLLSEDGKKQVLVLPKKITFYYPNYALGLTLTKREHERLLKYLELPIGG